MYLDRQNTPLFTGEMDYTAHMELWVTQRP